MNIKYLCAALALVGLAGCHYASPDTMVTNGDTEYVSAADVLYDSGGPSGPDRIQDNQAPAALVGLEGVNVDGFHIDTQGRKIFSIDVTRKVGGTLMRPGDVFRCNTEECTGAGVEKIFDIKASGFGVHVNVDAVSMNPDTGHLLLSTDTAFQGGVVSMGGTPDAPISAITQEVFLPGDVFIWDIDNAYIDGNAGVRVFAASELPEPNINVDAANWTPRGIQLSFDVSTELTYRSASRARLVSDDQLTQWLNDGTDQYFDSSCLGGTVGSCSSGVSYIKDSADLDAYYKNMRPSTSGDAIFSNGFETFDPR